ncbi:DUF1835 domain-containing protein [Lysinibacillus sphaericus]|uniref:DUF1835 domain-containing protein n=1 Tax=Lysinibacillus sphaericus OT4b.31 TaxID=1285586 RepID=R7ZES7_LYSSH|nr:DUF1835 domain-containing protein [Lysinibacillus sphaericus]EON72640.1 hypothetical protein H131_10883 [Lysinibacillus sphaericus OT4b.31]
MAILHITFSLSTQGSIKHAIRQNHLQRDESVICVNEIFSIGPLTTIEERQKWLASFILKDEEERELYDDIQKAWAKKIAGLPCDVDVWIWYSQNAHEEIGLRYVMSEFVNKCSMVYGVDVTEGLTRIQPNRSIRDTGQLPSHWLMKLRPDAKRFSVEACQRLAKEWHELKHNPSTLRTWENGIVHVAEDAYDSIIIKAAKDIRTNQGEEWLSAMPIINETLGEINDYISDAFIENRILKLAKQGLFAIDGDSTDMYSYQIKYIGK